ncbi:MAG: NAD-dependent epimerase/dehydratase family protein [Anaerolineales bacterium]|nr:NAD-dependent epimerase/dehydratase family protein [Anaerolineales bacterium]
MKILFIGGTGIISSACSQLAIERGYELTLLNRGQSSRPIPAGAKQIQADIRNLATTKAALEGHYFDVVVNWVAFTPEHIETDLALFTGHTGQYVFISSASAYQTPPAHLPISESTPLHNPFWEYSRQKIACEERLMRAHRETGFPVTVVRPSHTYDQTLLPMRGRYTVINRMRQGKKVVVHGDGTSLWTLTHHRDFAKGFVGLLGHPAAIGDVFHITSDELLTWNQIFQQVAAAAGAEAKLVHIPSATLARYDADWGSGLLGDKTHSVIFDNSKIKRLVPDFVATIPFWQGAQEIIAWYDADPARQVIEPAFDKLLDELIARYDPALI